MTQQSQRPPTAESRLPGGPALTAGVLTAAAAALKVLLDTKSPATAVMIGAFVTFLLGTTALASRTGRWRDNGAASQDVNFRGRGSWRLLVGGAPGIVLGCFATPDAAIVGAPVAAGLVVAASAASAAVYLLLHRAVCSPDPSRERALNGAFIAIAFALFYLFVSTHLLRIVGWTSVEVTSSAQATVVGLAVLWWLAYLERPPVEPQSRVLATEVPAEPAEPASPVPPEAAVAAVPDSVEIPRAADKEAEIDPAPPPARQPVLSVAQVQRIWRISNSDGRPIQVRLSRSPDAPSVPTEISCVALNGRESMDLDVARAVAYAMLDACRIAASRVK